MKNDKTVFVLGAGASCPYDYPSGWELRNKIIKNLRDCPENISATGANYWIRFIQEAGFSWGDIKEFCWAFERSNAGSIDFFLERRKEFVDIGKLAIAIGIAECENEDRNKFFSDEKKWYGALIDRLFVASFDEIKNNQIAFITFNYDRSLEYFLYTSMINMYEKKEDEIAKMLKNIPIIHVYGKLGNLPWEGEINKRAYGFSAEFLAPINKSAKCIKILHEGEVSSPEFIEARVHLQEASHIYFLGFGYHPVNLSRLEIDMLGIDKEIWGTAFGLGKAVKRDMQNKWSALQDGKLIPVKILPFINDYVTF